ncbi:MAG: putative glycoside hydrolase [Phototrophicaceae bacterium]
MNRLSRYIRLICYSVCLMIAPSLSVIYPVQGQTYPEDIGIQADPPSTVLPPNTTELSLTITTDTTTSCSYQWNNTDYQFDTEDGVRHLTILQRLNPDPIITNQIIVTCDAYSDNPLMLMYRSLPDANPSYPRTGNLWGSWEWQSNGRSLEYMSRVDLWLGANSFTTDEMRDLRRLNPDILFLSSANAIEWNPTWYPRPIPDDYWLRDVDGNRVEVWPGSYRLNLTKPEVAEMVAYSIYEEHLEYEMQFDGVFIDNIFLTHSWQNEDIFGNAFPVDADEDGIADDPQAFDIAWRAGVLHELRTLRALLPHAIFSGHAMDIYDPEIQEIFNGIGIGFVVPEIIEGQTEFQTFWQRYQAWMTDALTPQITMIESAVPYQIGYGYGYLPQDDMPSETWDFARDYYPYMRFGLALTLMQDAYFTHEIGDTYHGNDWWYDELDFELGYPLGEAQYIIPAGFNTETVYQETFERGF